MRTSLYADVTGKMSPFDLPLYSSLEAVAQKDDVQAVLARIFLADDVRTHRLHGHASALGVVYQWKYHPFTEQEVGHNRSGCYAAPQTKSYHTPFIQSFLSHTYSSSVGRGSVYSLAPLFASEECFLSSLRYPC